MRHGIKSKHFNRDVNQRKALLRELVVSVVKYGTITTTLPKAKEARRIADKLIHKAQTDSVATRRVLHRFFGKRDVVNTLVERIAPAMSDRSSGFTSIKQAGIRRGDSAAMVSLSLINMPERTGTLKASAEGETATKKVTTKAKSSVKPKRVSRTPDAQIQQQARAKEAQTGVKGEQPKVMTRKTMAQGGK